MNKNEGRSPRIHAIPNQRGRITAGIRATIQKAGKRLVRVEVRKPRAA